METRVIVFLAAMALAAVACTSMQPVTLTVEDEGRTIDMVPGQELVFKLESDFESYRWRLVPSMGAGWTEPQIDGDSLHLAPYIARMRQRIAAIWEVPTDSVGAGLRAVVYFRGRRDGSVSHVAVERSSGVLQFDRSCERAVMGAVPLASLPSEYGEEYLGVHFSFAYLPDAVLIPRGPPGYESRSSVNAGGIEIWRFEASQAGVQALQFEYARSLADKPAKVLTFTVRVK